MYSIQRFIQWALARVQKDSVPANAALALPADQCGSEPWQYLFGSIMVETTQATLDNYFINHYSNQMTRPEFDAITNSWSRDGYATDCQGLLDAWLTYWEGVSTDINADANYRLWCTDKGRIDELLRPYRIGEAVFRADDAGRMTHVGWICGFSTDGPLVVEARGIRYGVVITRLSKRSFTHRALMTKKFDYSEGIVMEPIKLTLTSPLMRGEAILALQYALNELGYTDQSGVPLVEDGKCGIRTLYAVGQFAKNQLEASADEEKPVFYIDSVGGDQRLKISIEKNKA